jgi:predicted dehydrogenase
LRLEQRPETPRIAGRLTALNTKGRSMDLLRLAVVGVGHLGKEHARILKSLPGVELIAVADVDHNQVQAVARKLDCLAFSNHRPLLQLADGVVIAAATSYHHAIAAEFLGAGIPTLVEKPLAATLEQAERLVDLARAHGTLLQVGHIERFNPAWEKLQSLSFEPKFVECERMGAFSGRSGDVGVVLDLMIHDLDLLQALVGSPVTQVSALGMSLFGKPEDVAAAHLVFSDGCVARVTASRASMTPRRSMRIWSAEGFLDLDFAKKTLTLVQPSEQVRQRGLAGLDASARASLKNDLFGRHLEVLELTDAGGPDGLTCELREFVHCVRTGAQPRVRGEDGFEAMKLAMRVVESLQQHAWQGTAAGPCGPTELPLPIGRLFTPATRTAAA